MGRGDRGEGVVGVGSADGERTGLEWIGFA